MILYRSSMWFTDSKSLHWLSWMTIFLFMALHIKITQIYNCRIIEKLSFPVYTCHPVGSLWNVSSIKTLLSTPTGFMPHVISTCCEGVKLLLSWEPLLMQGEDSLGGNRHMVPPHPLPSAWLFPVNTPK